jgi:death-on-curing protein
MGAVMVCVDEGRLISVELAPQQVVFGQEQYETVFEKAAVYFRNIIADHPYVDGNKRTATTVCGIFLSRNGHRLTAAPKELEDFAGQNSYRSSGRAGDCGLAKKS